VEVQETERRYIARELHDQAGQSLSFLMLGLGQLEKDANQMLDTQSHVEKLKQLTNDILEDLHRLAVNLRPASLDHLGLVPALDQFLKSFATESRLQIHFRANGLQDAERLAVDIETTLYRIVQESLTNILRHAKASHADVILERRDDSLILIVEDNGAILQLPPQHHIGLLNSGTANVGGKTNESVPYLDNQE
jgi:signal transduction histidine kinase